MGKICKLGKLQVLKIKFLNRAQMDTTQRTKLVGIGAHMLENKFEHNRIISDRVVALEILVF